jgi:hypothetical protein
MIYFMDFTHTRATYCKPFLTSHQETIFLQAINIIKDYYWPNLHHYKSPMEDKFLVFMPSGRLIYFVETLVIYFCVYSCITYLKYTDVQIRYFFIRLLNNTNAVFNYLYVHV